MPNPYIIAEAGSCHEEDLQKAYALIHVAAKAGADACKFQFWSNPGRMRERRHLTGRVYDEGSIKEAWMALLKRECEDAKIAFACSVYLPEDVVIVSRWVDAFKVASFEALDLELIGRILDVRGQRPLYISTGMQGEYDVRPTKPEEAVYFHCVSAYPCPLEDASLGAIERNGAYSDHTRCVYTGGFAVASGADFLEVHYRLGTTSPVCPDYPVALTPEQLERYIELARTAHEMRGTGEKRVQPSEQMNIQYRVSVS